MVAGCAPGVFTIESRVWFQSITGWPDSSAFFAAAFRPCARGWASALPACKADLAARAEEDLELESPSTRVRSGQADTGERQLEPALADVGLFRGAPEDAVAHRVAVSCCGPTIPYRSPRKSSKSGPPTSEA